MSATHQDLAKLEHDWMDAVRRKDVATLEQILAPEFIYTASGHGRQSRQEWLITLANYDLHSFRFIDVDVREYDDVGVVLSHYQQEAVVAGAPRSGEFLITDVWVRREEGRQVVARSSIMQPHVPD